MSGLVGVIEAHHLWLAGCPLRPLQWEEAGFSIFETHSQMMRSGLPSKRARVEPPAPAADAAAAAAAATAPAAPPPAAAPDGPGIIFVPLVVSSFAAVAEKLTAFMSLPTVRRSLAALAHGAGGDTQMPMPFIPLSSLGGGAPQKGPAAPPTAAATAAALDELDHLLISLELDHLLAGADHELPGSDG